ncbi:hypothetical protein LMG28614_05528 [Paraburkholderia ultramafica]|uniref:Uncharacterized protein n=1 Tax=Paraburkholderia ultramafica TaxID=1544867 RepID=A0A6S7DD27_9BURK|nr:hypothetical protein LMG28614_05528 [Paraburkholderia ultramafica]
MVTDQCVLAIFARIDIHQIPASWGLNRDGRNLSRFGKPALAGLCISGPGFSRSSPASALRDALRHAVECGGLSSLGVLHQGVLSASTLTGTDATAQAARIRRQLDRLAPLPRAARTGLRAASAQVLKCSSAQVLKCSSAQVLKCSCGARCCSGSYQNSEWTDANARRRGPRIRRHARAAASPQHKWRRT